MLPIYSGAPVPQQSLLLPSASPQPQSSNVLQSSAAQPQQYTHPLLAGSYQYPQTQGLMAQLSQPGAINSLMQSMAPPQSATATPAANTGAMPAANTGAAVADGTTATPSGGYTGPDYSQIALQMAGNPHAGAYAAAPVPTGSFISNPATTSTGSSSSTLGTTAAGLLGLLATNPALVKSLGGTLGSGLSSLLGLTPSSSSNGVLQEVQSPGVDMNLGGDTSASDGVLQEVQSPGVDMNLGDSTDSTDTSDDEGDNDFLDLLGSFSSAGGQAAGSADNVLSEVQSPGVDMDLGNPTTASTASTGGSGLSSILGGLGTAASGIGLLGGLAGLTGAFGPSGVNTNGTPVLAGGYAPTPPGAATQAQPVNAPSTASQLANYAGQGGIVDAASTGPAPVNGDPAFSGTIPSLGQLLNGGDAGLGAMSAIAQAATGNYLGAASSAIGAGGKAGLLPTSITQPVGLLTSALTANPLGIIANALGVGNGLVNMAGGLNYNGSWSPTASQVSSAEAPGNASLASLMQNVQPLSADQMAAQSGPQTSTPDPNDASANTLMELQSPGTLMGLGDTDTTAPAGFSANGGAQPGLYGLAMTSSVPTNATPEGAVPQAPQTPAQQAAMASYVQTMMQALGINPSLVMPGAYG